MRRQSIFETMSTGDMGEFVMEQNDKEFAFIKEKIKDKPINKKRLLMRIAYDILFAFVFGVTACFAFVYFKPHIEEWMHPKKDQTITIPKDEEPKAEAENETKEEPQKPDTVYVQEKLDVEGYQELQKDLYAIGKQANKSVVTVTGVISKTDIFNTPYESQNQAAGVIIANNGHELLILTERKVIADAKSLSITFNDNQTVSAALKKYDGNTGIAIVGVKLSDISQETMNRIEVATLGNSLMLTQGSMVIAIGNPLGANYSILCGTITSSQNKVTTIDNNYTIFTTDMVGSESGSGALINLSGEVVGVVLKDYSNQGDRNTITALSISELKQIIEDLSNNQDIPYLGLRISAVTDEIADKYSIPKGVYVKGVEMDSPAMTAGIQEADVIVKMNGNDVVSVEQYNQFLMELKPGDEMKITVKRQGAEEYVDLNCKAVIGVLK